MMGDYFDDDEVMTEDIALRLIDAHHEDSEAVAYDRVIEAWQYMLDNELYLNLPAWYRGEIERLLDEGVIE